MFVVVIGIVLGVEVVVVVVQSWREGVGGCSNTQICCVEVVVVWLLIRRLSGGGGSVHSREIEVVVAWGRWGAGRVVGGWHRGVGSRGLDLQQLIGSHFHKV